MDKSEEIRSLIVSAAGSAWSLNVDLQNAHKLTRSMNSVEGLGLKVLLQDLITVTNHIYKTSWNNIEDRPGIYLLLNGSCSVWAGFKSMKEAKTCLQVLPNWKVIKRK